MEMKGFNLARKDLIAILLIFCLALGIRLMYQHSAEVRNQIISDAKEYFLGAYNLRFFGVYSTSPPPSPDTPPKPNAGRTPGYSLFLLPFLYTSKTIPEFVNKVVTAQAVLGALTSVFAFLAARYSLPFAWAFTGGLLTCFSPHLIAMDDYLLTESLFTFVTITAFLFFVVSFHRKGKAGLITSGISGLFWGLSFLVKPMAMLLGPFMAFVYLIPIKKANAFTFRKELNKACVLFFVFLLTVSPFFLRNYLTLKQLFPEQGRGWGSIVDGTYINLIYKDPRFYGYPYRDDPLNAKMHKDKKFFWDVFMKRFEERPLEYLKWYLGGKILCSWRWDVVTGHHDVYVYPMKKLGFHNDELLFFVHSIMKMLHWPLFWLAVSTPMLLLFLRWKNAVNEYLFYCLPYAFIISYFFAMVTVMFPIPRYTIPIRPYVYNLALFNMFTILSLLFKGKKRGE